MSEFVDHPLWQWERRVTIAAERVGLYLLMQGLRLRGLIFGKGIPS